MLINVSGAASYQSTDRGLKKKHIGVALDV
jgi:hypothetical protein